MNEQPDQRAASEPGRRSWFWYAVVAMVLAIAGVAGSVSWFLTAVPFPRLADVTAPRVIVLTSADGKMLRHAGQLRFAPVAAKDMPPALVNAVLSIEDRRFYERGAIDFVSILRALGQNLTAGRIVEGGSTITQQLVKTNFLSPERTYQRKIREAAISIWLEHHLTKDQILTSYLNSVYLGSGAIGFPAAAKLYFNKNIADLSLPEAAMLAGLINAPEENDPLRQLPAARKRAATVLDAMVTNGKLTEEQAVVAKLHPATPNPGNVTRASDGWFGDWVYGKALSVTPAHAGTVEIKTTLDPQLQQKAIDIVKNVLAKYGDEKHATQAALVAMRPDGAVIAMVGGRNYAKSSYNRAVQAERQPGSAFKLFDYYAAFRQGYTPQDEILDAPVDIHGWQPENYGHRHHGKVTLADAFADSLNDAAVRLSQQVGIDQVIAAARDLGLHAKLSNSPSLALGTSEVTLLNLTSTYAAVRAGKAPVTPWGISGIKLHGEANYVSANGREQSQHDLGQYQAELIKLLQGVVDHGTGRAAKLQGFAAGKTGTTQDYRDAWFIGFDDSLITGVWVGNDNHSPMKNVTGGSLPVMIWKAFMEQAEPIEQAAREPTTVGLAPATTAPQDSTLPNDASASAEQNPTPSPQEVQNAQCNVSACQESYHSFRSSDCTYQPYSGGPRQYCAR
jgi:1A family penicillin-binding protein